MTDGLIIPAVMLAIAGFVVPCLLARNLPEGVAALVLNGFLATALMSVISAVIFFGLYVLQGAAVAALAGEGIITNVRFFGRLGLSAGLIWAPILMLSLAGLPHKWEHAPW